MNKYDCILFDADNTLFSFDQSTALKQVLSQHGVTNLDEALQQYKTLNKQLWRYYEANAISLDDLQADRFMPWTNHRDKAKALNSKFLLTIAAISKPLTGAESLLTQLKQTSSAKIGLISNGFTLLHSYRLQKTNFSQYFDQVITSEDAGIAKPSPNIFKFALRLLDININAKILMVGDNLNADIYGASQLGFDTCWINKDQIHPSNKITPTYEVTALDDLANLLIKKKIPHPT